MSQAATFMVSLGQCLSTLSLYPTGHPSRERVVDVSYARLTDLLRDVAFAEFSIIGDRVVYQGRPVDELRGWDWATRLSGTGIERIEVDAGVTRDAWEVALEGMWRQLNGRPLETHDGRQLVASPVRFGSLRLMGGTGEAAAAALSSAEVEAQAIAAAELRTLSVSLSEEIATVSWIHEEALTLDRIPMAEVEAVVGSLAIAMHQNQRMLLPLVMMKEYDQYTTTHACNVSVLAMGLAEKLGLSRAEIRAFGVAGLLHDIGKVRIPIEILNKPGRLTPEEIAIMSRHPAEGARLLLEREKGMQLSAVVAYEHHVCLDGRGYPRFHNDRGCHIASRIVHVCDVYDALSTNRPYRKPWSSEQSLHYIEEKAGTDVDPVIAKAFTEMVRGSTLARLPMPEDLAVVT